MSLLSKSSSKDGNRQNLDVAGAGRLPCSALQEAGKDVHAIDISPSVEVMKRAGST